MNGVVGVVIEQVYPNLRVALMEILRTKGVTGLYAGLTPSLLEIVPYAGLQFGTYDVLKRWTAVRAFKMFVVCFLH